MLPSTMERIDGFKGGVSDWVTFPLGEKLDPFRAPSPFLSPFTAYYSLDLVLFLVPFHLDWLRPNWLAPSELILMVRLKQRHMEYIMAFHHLWKLELDGIRPDQFLDDERSFHFMAELSGGAFDP